MGLSDGILIKDNHIASSVVPALPAGRRRPSSVRALVEAAEKKKPKGKKLEIEGINLS